MRPSFGCRNRLFHGAGPGAGAVASAADTESATTTTTASMPHDRAPDLVWVVLRAAMAMFGWRRRGHADSKFLARIPRRHKACVSGLRRRSRDAVPRLSVEPRAHPLREVRTRFSWVWAKDSLLRWEWVAKRPNPGAWPRPSAARLLPWRPSWTAHATPGFTWSWSGCTRPRRQRRLRGSR